MLRKKLNYDVFGIVVESILELVKIEVRDLGFCIFVKVGRWMCVVYNEGSVSLDDVVFLLESFYEGKEKYLKKRL